MKRILIPLFSAIIIGTLLGKVVFDQYQKEVEQVFKNTENVYFFQQGVYSSEENAKNHASHNNNYIIVKDGKFYRVYLAATKNKNNVEKIKEVFINVGNDIYVRELNVSNVAFIDLMEQYDKLLDITNNDNEIIQIEKQVINKYKELVLDNE